MKLAFIFNYPLMDNVNWKKTVIENCLNAGYEVDIYYGKTALIEYIKAYLAKRKFGSIGSVSKNLQKKTEKNYKYFKSLGVNTYKVKNYNSDKTIQLLFSKKYDFIVAAIDQILSRNFVDNVNSKILNIHYATLPQIKGMNAIEWNYLVNKKCELTLHHINSGIDTGSIIKTEEIPIEKGEDFFSMREKLQQRIPKALMSFFEKPDSELFPNNGGKLYTFMHSEIQQIMRGRF
ncbi:formyltransferase family protein [Aquimarina latercula]|uniref:formyltransferase family protein n=1 Tax=Aquimarina latercula TaxID=987 RepID=UPI0004261741|nr:formyltransferase family protein [Aquimarina latercula]